MDNELEILKKRKMIELKRRLLAQDQIQKDEETSSQKELLNKYFYGRAWEIFRTASAQFPHVMTRVEAILIEAIREGKIKDRIDGESLYHFLKQIGIPVKLRTTIRYKEHGELKTIEQRIKES